MAGEGRWTRAQGRTFAGLDQPARSAIRGGTLHFAQLADTQFGFEGSATEYPVDLEHARKAVVALNRLRPRFAIVCGDLINAWPHDPEPVRRQQTADFKRVFAALDPAVELVCVCGNHDVGNRPTAATLASWQADFGDDWFAFHDTGLACIVINTNLLADPAGAPDLHAEQLRWLDATAARARAADARHIVLFGHHPLFLHTAHERAEDEFLDEDVIIDEPTGRVIRIPHGYFHVPFEQRLPVLSIMREHGIHWFFGGHFHRNQVAHSRDYGITCVTTSAVGRQLGGDDHGFRIVQVSDRGIAHRYYALDAMPERLPVL